MDRNDHVQVHRVLVKDLLESVGDTAITVDGDTIHFWLDGPNVKVRDGQTNRTLSVSLHAFARRMVDRPVPGILYSLHRTARGLIQQSLTNTN